jgi:enoyl-CoA hydratase
MSLVLVEISDHVATITLNDPDRRNAINLAMNAELSEIMDEIEDGDVRSIVVTGASPAFCAGADLGELAAADEDGLRDIYSGFLRVAHTPLPTIAAVNGPAVGAGFNFAIACDVILAGRSARFDARFLQIGIHPGGGHTWRLQHRVSLQAAKAMVLFGERVNGERAGEIGLAWRCVDDDELLSTARSMATRAAAVPAGLAARTKATLDTTSAIDESNAAVEHELDPQVWSMKQGAFTELVAELQDQISSKQPR